MTTPENELLALLRTARAMTTVGQDLERRIQALRVQVAQPDPMLPQTLHTIHSRTDA